MLRNIFALFLALLLPACGSGGERGPVNVAIFAEQESLFQQGVRLSTAGQHMRAATHEGLVALDPAGQIIPALAERWIVTDDGLSYIFRLRDSRWPDDEQISAEEVAASLRSAVRQLDGTSLGLDLAKLTEVRAMAGRVVELRLSSPMPDFLRLLAQPELGLSHRGTGAGPMALTRDQDAGLVRLSALPPERRGLPALEDWAERARGLTVRGLSGQAAVDAFANAYPVHWGSRVVLTMQDGSEMSQQVSDARGDPELPLSAGEMADKARGLLVHGNHADPDRLIVDVLAMAKGGKVPDLAGIVR